MTNKSVLALVAVILLSAFLPIPAAAADYFPLFMGWYQTYHGYDPGDGYYTATYDVHSTKVVSGTTCYVISSGGDPANGYWAVAKVNGDLYIYEEFSPDSGTVTYDDEQPLYLPGQLKVGQQWTYFEEGERHTATCLSTTETVTTPAGTFTNCLMVKREDSDSFQYHWYAPNVGEVRVYDAGGTEKETLELVTYTTGSSCDNTAPSTPTVIDEGSDSYGNTLRVTALSVDTESGVVAYQIAISTNPDPGLITSEQWEDLGGDAQITSPPLPLGDGNTYYMFVKARNGAGLWSQVGVSDGITIHNGPSGTSPWPLEVGNRWQYQISSTESGDRVGYINVERATQVSGQARYTVLMDCFHDDDERLDFTAAWQGEDMLVYSVGGQTADPPMLFFDGPLSVGRTWNATQPSGSVTHFEVLADNETVVTPAGTFTGCIKIKETWNDWPNDMDLNWFKPGVGLVRKDTYEDGMIEVDEIRLLSGWHVVAGPSDVTPPPAPIVTDDGDDTYGSIVRAGWTCSDPESGVVEYQAALSSTPDESGILPGANWRAVGAGNFAAISGAALESDCYVLVRARNRHNLWSPIGVSDGISVHRSMPGGSFYPLRDGHRWRFGEYIHTTGIEQRFACAAVSPVVLGDGSTAYRVVNQKGNCDNYVAADSSDGYYIYSINNVPYSTPWKAVSYPITPGSASSSPDGQFTFTVEATDITVGDFTGCARFRMAGNSPVPWYELIWRAPGVGIVQTEYWYDGTRTRSTSLSSYYLKPADRAGVTTVASGLRQVSALCVDSGQVYFTEGSCASSGYAGVSKVPVTGGTPTRLTGQSPAPGHPLGIVVDGLAVYFTQNVDGYGGALSEVSTGGGAWTNAIASLNAPRFLIRQGGDLFWPEDGPSGGSLIRSTCPECPPPPPPSVGASALTLCSSPGMVMQVVADENYVYWADLDEGTVSRVPRDGGTRTILASGLAQPWTVALDSDYIYWSEYGTGGNGAIWKLAKAGGPAVRIAQGLAGPLAVAADGDRVFWTEGFTMGTPNPFGSVKWVSRLGGPVHVVAEHLNNPIMIALDGDYVYWCEGSVIQSAGCPVIPPADGAIKRAPKDTGRNPKHGVDGDPVLITSAVVSAAWDDVFYLEADERNAGLRVELENHGIEEGMRADVTGYIDTNANGERYIAADVAVQSDPPNDTGFVGPLGMSCKAIGGADWNYDSSTGAGQRGVVGGAGLNNIGLLVRTCGKVTQFDTAVPPTWFKIDDGSGVSVKCVVPDDVTINTGWQIVGVTGVSSCEKVGDDLERVLLVRTQDDIDVISGLAKLGSDAILRTYPGADGGSDYAFVDVQPVWPMTSTGHLATWHVYANAQPPVPFDQVIHLLVWRPTADPTQYQLIVRDPVTITAGNGLKTIPASASARAKTIQPGDLLGFYIPAGVTPMISMDFAFSPSVEPLAFGGAGWTEGQLVGGFGFYNTRIYSLYADIEP